MLLSRRPLFPSLKKHFFLLEYLCVNTISSLLPLFCSPSLFFSLPSPWSSHSFVINGPHSFHLTVCMPMCPPPPALYSFLWFFLPVSFHDRGSHPSQAAVSSNLQWSPISPPSLAASLWILVDANGDVVCPAISRIHCWPSQRVNLLFSCVFWDWFDRDLICLIVVNLCFKWIRINVTCSLYYAAVTWLHDSV